MKSELYRPLRGGEIIQVGDEYDGCNDPWRDDAKWMLVTEASSRVGQPAPDPRFPAHTRFRRRLTQAERDEFSVVWGNDN